MGTCIDYAHAVGLSPSASMTMHVDVSDENDEDVVAMLSILSTARLYGKIRRVDHNDLAYGQKNSPENNMFPTPETYRLENDLKRRRLEKNVIISGMI